MVQQFREREVAPSGIVPGYQNVQYSPDAFGAGIGRALGQLGGSISDLGTTLGRLQDEKRANDALEKETQAMDEVRPWLFDPNDGLYSKQGGQAMGVERQGAAVLEDIQQRYLAEIDDPKTAEAFRKMWMRKSESIKDGLARHELAQLGTYKVETSKAVVLGSMQDAYNYYNDESAVGKAIEDSIRAIRVNSAGLPEEALAAAEEEARSQIHLAVISRWAEEDPYKAADYYRNHKDEFTGKDHVTATKLVSAAESNRKAVEFVTSWQGTSVAADRFYEAVEFAESSGNPNAVSEDGAVGPMQLHHLPSVREQLIQFGRGDLAALGDEQLKTALSGPENASVNRMVGRGMLNKFLNMFDGDYEAALVAYNSGEERARAFLAHNAGRTPGTRDYNVPDMPWLEKETRPYVEKIMARMGVSSDPRSVPAGTRMTKENWKLQNFRPDELMASQGDGQWVDARAAYGLDDLTGWMKQQFPGITVAVNAGHDFSGNPLIPQLGNRRGTRSTNDLPKGSAGKTSRHVHGDAFDIQVQGWTDEQKSAFIVEARKRGFGGVGFYGPAGHLHIDMGSQRTWGRTPAWAREALKTPRGAGPVAGPGRGGGGAGPSSFTPNASQGVSSADLPTGQNSVFQNTGAGAYAAPSGFDINAALREANMIADPTQRERTIAMLRLADAEQQQKLTARQQAAKQQAWDFVQSGSAKDLPPQLLSQLEPGYVNTLFAYEKNRAEGGPVTNAEIWARIPVDPVELARLDPLDYRNDLADKEWFKLTEMVRAAQLEVKGQATDSTLLRNMRSMKDISDGIAIEMGWDTSTPKGGAMAVAFARKFDQYISDAQQAKGAELSAPEMQQIADRLLIEGSQPGGWFGMSQSTRAFKATDPNQFTAASTWDQVSVEDQRQLITSYEEIFGNEPDQETAVDLYNRAMVVWLGGKPDGPEEEIDAMREAIETATGRRLTPRELEQAYGRYLLRFLGR